MVFDPGRCVSRRAMKRRRNLEQSIQKAVLRYLALCGVSDLFCFHVPNGGKRGRIEAAILKSMGVRAGVPDLVLIRAGLAYCLELKAPLGRLTPAQRAAHLELRKAGATVGVAHGLDAAIEQLKRWGLVRVAG
jgi:hypothetical protein